MKRLYILTLCTVTAAVAIFLTKMQTPATVPAGDGQVLPGAWLISNNKTMTPPTDVRPGDQTFLTFPEWYLVFSPEEQADYFEHSTSSTFPFVTHTRQIWGSYRIVNDQINGNFPPNPGYHLMIWVIGTSSSVEYLIKAWYETIVGRLTDTGNPLTGEDRLNARAMRAYTDFINDLPWYQFDFKRPLHELWSETPIFGSHPIRKLERRYFLTSELLVKLGYAKLIGLGTEQVYEEALLTTSVVLENDSVLMLPRYNRFAGAAMELAKQGHSFKEIAGNTTAIMITVLVPDDGIESFDGTQTIFTQPMSSDPTWKRVALTTPVAQLHRVLLDFSNRDVKIEHVFDY